jgi:hypothetical protein
MFVVEHAVANQGRALDGIGSQAKYQLGHHCGGLPLTSWNTRIEVREPGPQQGLPHIGSDPRGRLDPRSILAAHACVPFVGELARPPAGSLGPLGATPESLKRVERSGNPSGRSEAPRKSKCSSCKSRSPVMTPDLDRS